MKRGEFHNVIKTHISMFGNMLGRTRHESQLLLHWFWRNFALNMDSKGETKHPRCCSKMWFWVVTQNKHTEITYPNVPYKRLSADPICQSQKTHSLKDKQSTSSLALRNLLSLTIYMNCTHISYYIKKKTL